jgi:putative copper export protein
LLLKLALVAALLAFAALHRFAMTRNLGNGRPGAGAAMANSILVEAAVALAAIVATVAFASRFSPQGG